MACCDDPTEPKKIDRRELIRLQEQYGELVRNLLTDDPERVILKLLDSSNIYLTELAALQAHHRSVRMKAIDLLGKPSRSVLQQIAKKATDSDVALAARKRIERIG